MNDDRAYILDRYVFATVVVAGVVTAILLAMGIVQ